MRTGIRFYPGSRFFDRFPESHIAGANTDQATPRPVVFEDAIAQAHRVQRSSAKRVFSNFPEFG
ncbi:MAG: hypothetical protein ACR2I2_24045 [Bryobacteraceae bacterium]